MMQYNLISFTVLINQTLLYLSHFILKKSRFVWLIRKCTVISMSTKHWIITIRADYDTQTFWKYFLLMKNSENIFRTCMGRWRNFNDETQSDCRKHITCLSHFWFVGATWSSTTYIAVFHDLIWSCWSC